MSSTSLDLSGAGSLEARHFRASVKITRESLPESMMPEGEEATDEVRRLIALRTSLEDERRHGWLLWAVRARIEHLTTNSGASKRRDREIVSRVLEALK